MAVVDEKDWEQEIAQRSTKVDGLISQNNFLEALKVAIQDPPQSKKDGLKGKAVAVAARVFEVVKDAQIEKIIDDLTPDQRDSTMKYVYKALATGKNCASLLKWHGALTDKSGLGIVMRALVDKKF